MSMRICNFVLLPKEPMRYRQFDPRVGYFASYTWDLAKFWKFFSINAFFNFVAQANIGVGLRSWNYKHSNGSSSRIHGFYIDGLGEVKGGLGISLGTDFEQQSGGQGGQGGQEGGGDAGGGGGDAGGGDAGGGGGDAGGGDAGGDDNISNAPAVVNAPSPRRAYDGQGFSTRTDGRPFPLQCVEVLS